MLNVRERRIFGARQLIDDPVTLEDLAVEFGVSRERVRQIEVRALEKVKKAVQVRVAMMAFRQADSQSVDFGTAIRSVAPPKMTWAAHRCGTCNSVVKALIGSLAASPETPVSHIS